MDGTSRCFGQMKNIKRQSPITINMSSNYSLRDEFKTLLENTHIPANASEELVREAWERIFKFVLANLPDTLFRFRQANDWSLDSFRKKTITVCHPSIFPDKYDSLIYVNTDEQYLSQEISRQMVGLHQLGFPVSVDMIPDLIRLIKEKTANHQAFLKSNSFIRIACFTERVDSKFMWDNYGGGYKGFALEYDMRKYCMEMARSETPFNLYPVIYSGERYDSSRDALYAAAWDLIPPDCQTVLEVMKKNCPGPDQLFWYRSYLYKSADEYSREKEWRLIHSIVGSNSQDDYMDIPDYDSVKAIYYGPDISLKHKMALHKIAQKREIEEYDVVVANSRGYALEIEHCSSWAQNL